MENYNTKAIIEVLGGTHKVAKYCKVSPGAVSQWRFNGIPFGHLVVLAARIEKESKGLVTRKTLFPDDFRNIWPELIDNSLIDNSQ